jgi:hypothetical protein
MRMSSSSALLFLFCAALVAQDPEPTKNPVVSTQEAAAPAPVVFTSDAGFTFSYPSDWEVVDSKPMMPALQQKVEDQAKSELEKKGADCTQIALLLRHGTPKSSIVVMVLPYSCVDQAVNASDLPATAEGMAEGIKRGYDISHAEYGAYKLGHHDIWIERAEGTSKTHPDQRYTIEIVAVMLKRAMVCWMGFVRDDASLKALEDGQTSLEGENAVPLVPATAFKGKRP